MDLSARKFMAFISYRHADNRQEGRQWATWLHHSLETFDIPKDLVGQKNARGQVIPDRIYPVFRDEEELPAHANLASSITTALDNTSMLVVLCSPNAVASSYVADEIAYFKQLGHASRIIAAMIDGEPNASLDLGKQRQGIDPAAECFPLPLQFEYDDQGRRTDKRAEPIAADFRLNLNGEARQGWCSPEALRLELTETGDLSRDDINKIVTDYESQLQLMLLKIVAGVIGVPLGLLRERDKLYQLEQERLKTRKLRRWIAAISVTGIAAAVLGVLAWNQREIALERLALVEQKTRQVYGSVAESHYEKGQTLEGLIYARLSYPDKDSLKQLYRGLLLNQRVFLSGKQIDSLPQHMSGLSPAQWGNGRYGTASQNGYRIEEAVDGDRDCGLSYQGMILDRADKPVARYCESTRIDEPQITFSPQGKWVFSHPMAQSSVALFRVDAPVIGPQMRDGIGRGKIVDNSCVAFGHDENLVAFKGFDGKIFVHAEDDNYGEDNIIATLGSDSCPLAFLDNQTLVTWKDGKILGWSLAKADQVGDVDISPWYDPDVPWFEREEDTESVPPAGEDDNIALQTVSSDGKLRARIVLLEENDNSHTNRLELLDHNSGDIIFSWDNVQNDFWSGADGNNSPDRMKFLDGGRVLMVLGLHGYPDLFRIYPYDDSLLDRVKTVIPCGRTDAAIQMTDRVAALCDQAAFQ